MKPYFSQVSLLFNFEGFPNLHHISLLFYRWNGRYIGASVVWAIPTAYGVKICLVLKEITSIMTFHNTGHFMTKSDIEYTIIDGGKL